MTVVLALGQMIGFEHTPIVVEVPSGLMRDKLLQVAGPNLHPVIVAEFIFSCDKRSCSVNRA